MSPISAYNLFNQAQSNDNASAKFIAFKIKPAKSQKIKDLQKNFSISSSTELAVSSPLELPVKELKNKINIIFFSEVLHILPTDIWLKIIEFGMPKDIYEAKKYFHTISRVSKKWKEFSQVGKILWINRFHGTFERHMEVRRFKSGLKYLKTCGKFLQIVKLCKLNRYPSHSIFKDLKDRHIDTIIAACPNITYITVPDCQISSASIEKIFTKLIHLECFKINGCIGVTKLPSVFPPKLQALSLACRNINKVPDDFPLSMRKFFLWDIGSYYQSEPAENFNQLPLWIRSTNTILQSLVLSHLIHLKLSPDFNFPQKLLELCLANNTQIDSWPLPLPLSLKKLELGRMDFIEELPPLPEGLEELAITKCKKLKENQLLISLPKSLIRLLADQNLLKGSELPENLKILTIHGSGEIDLPCSLPEGLVYLCLSEWGGQELNLPSWPRSLEVLYHTSRAFFYVIPEPPFRNPRIRVETFKNIRLKHLKDSRWYKQQIPRPEL